jgi:hypothetical protein
VWLAPWIASFDPRHILRLAGKSARENVRQSLFY